MYDAATKDAALAFLKKKRPGWQKRVAEMKRDGYPAYTTSAGWLGYPEDKIRALCKELLAEGRYFDAEERFASALGIKRGDVIMMIGEHELSENDRLRPEEIYLIFEMLRPCQEFENAGAFLYADPALECRGARYRAASPAVAPAR